MHILYNLFYRQFGVRRLQHLIQPTTNRLDSLPKSAMLHYLSHDIEHPDVDTSKLYLSTYGAKRIMVDFPLNIVAIKDTPTRLNGVIRDLTKPFFKVNRNYRFLPDAYKTINDPESLVINNYSYIDVVNRYPQTAFEEYNRWLNSEATRWKTIGDITNISDRQHFVFIDVPMDIPSRNTLDLFVDQYSTSMLRVFHTDEHKFILELWKWLDPKFRSTSIFRYLKEQHLGKINIVFTTKDGKSTVLNLGYLSSWSVGAQNLTEFNRVEQLTPEKIQKLFLKFLITLNTAVAPVEEQVEENTPVIDEDALLDSNADFETDDEGQLANNLTTNKEVSKTELEVKLSDTDIEKELNTSLDIDTQLKDIDKELEELEVINKRQLQAKGIKLDQNAPELTAVDETKSLDEITADIYQNVNYTDALQSSIDKQADFGLISASDYKKLSAEAKAYVNGKDPYGKNRTIAETINIKPEDLKLDSEKNKIAVSHVVKDQSMASSSLQTFDSDYVNKMMDRHVVASIASMQRAGVVVRRHEVEIDHSALGVYENHTLEIKPVDGQPSTIHFRLAKVNEDGTFVSGGNKYIMRKQRADLPIRKISPTEVALSSYYGKTFVNLSPKKVDDPIAWLVKKIIEASINEDTHITKVAPANVYDNNFKAPYIYSALSCHFKGFKAGKFNLTFDHNDRLKFANEETLAKVETNGSVLVGFTDSKKPVLIDKDSNFYIYQNNSLDLVGDIYNILNLTESDAPLPFSEVRFFSKTIPVGVVLGYFLGFANLVKFLNIEYRIVEGRKQKMMHAHQFAITFKDISYIFSRKDKIAAYILAGFIDFEKQIKHYAASEFNKKDVYFKLLESKGLGSLYVREMELTDQMFVDPVTESVLKKMGEPLTFRGLLIRSTELLTTYYHPDTQDMKVMRVKGYERFSGAVYKELVTSIRQFKNSNLAGKSKINMSPYQIWNSIAKDAAIKIVEDTNPIQNLKESESITYVGEGGRSKDSMSKPTRAYHVNDMGIVSEATVDSSDVGVNAYLSANPNLVDMLGSVGDEKQINPASLLSTSALLAVGSVNDDAKRTNFISIQQGHTICSQGYHQPMVRTGYEYVIGNRTSEMFAYLAKQDGKVVALSDKGVIVEYVDGTRKGVNLGRQYGKAEGSVYPHDIVSAVKLNQKFKKGDAIAYNTGFFEIDFLDPTKVVMKNSMNVKVALLESNQTHEDSSAISAKVSEKLTAKTTKIKSFTVGFNQNILNAVKPGQSVNPKDILMTIEDEITSTGNSFDTDSLATLRKLAKQSPKAKLIGTIDKIEVFYHGDKDDMSPSIKALADRSDKLMAEACKATGSPVITGQVNEDYRVAGKPLLLDKAEIRIYITIQTRSAVGDKGVFASQMKSTHAEVMNYKVTSESGEEIDTIFSYRSILKRIVNSPIIIGTTNTLLILAAKKTVEAYRN